MVTFTLCCSFYVFWNSASFNDLMIDLISFHMMVRACFRSSEVLLQQCYSFIMQVEPESLQEVCLHLAYL